MTKIVLGNIEEFMQDDLIEAYQPISSTLGIGTSRVDKGFILSFFTAVEKKTSEEAYPLEKSFPLFDDEGLNEY